MNIEEEQKPNTSGLLAVILVLSIFVGLVITKPIWKYSSEAVDASEPTETTIVETSAPIETTEVTVATEAVTEPVTQPTETTEIVEEPEPEVAAPMSNLEMLAIVIYQEAGGDAACDDCRRRVADVVLNRVAHSSFPYTIEGVLTQPYQYGLLWQTGLVWPERASNPSEAAAVERAYRIAAEILSGHHSELFGKGYIWQAEFIQGRDNIYHCGHYFGR